MKRNEFIKMTLGTLGALTLTNGFANNSVDECAKIKKFGLQLWSVRDDMAKDAKAVLEQLGKAGYNKIESFIGAKGMWWGNTPQQFSAMVKDNGMQIVSGHCNEKDDAFKKIVDEAASINMQYLIYAWEGPNRTIDEYKKMANDFNTRGELCKKAGIQYAFHNHDYSFKKLEGQFAQDVLMQNTDANLVQFEMDMYWVVTAGQDPIEWMKKYPNRFTLSHIKDREINATTNDASCMLGTGSIDYAKIIKYARKNGMQHFMVEQEKWTNSTPMDSANANAKYFKKLKV